MALHEKVALTFFHFRFLDGVNLECVRLVWGVSCSWDAIGNVVSRCTLMKTLLRGQVFATPIERSLLSGQ